MHTVFMHDSLDGGVLPHCKPPGPCQLNAQDTHVCAASHSDWTCPCSWPQHLHPSLGVEVSYRTYAADCHLLVRSSPKGGLVLNWQVGAHTGRKEDRSVCGFGALWRP